MAKNRLSKLAYLEGLAQTYGNVDTFLGQICKGRNYVDPEIAKLLYKTENSMRSLDHNYMYTDVKRHELVKYIPEFVGKDNLINYIMIDDYKIDKSFENSFVVKFSLNKNTIIENLKDDEFHGSLKFIIFNKNIKCISNNGPNILYVTQQKIYDNNYFTKMKRKFFKDENMIPKDRIIHVWILGEDEMEIEDNFLIIKCYEFIQESFCHNVEGDTYSSVKYTKKKTIQKLKIPLSGNLYMESCNNLGIIKVKETNYVHTPEIEYC